VCCLLVLSLLCWEAWMTVTLYPSLSKLTCVSGAVHDAQQAHRGEEARRLLRLPRRR